MAFCLAQSEAALPGEFGDHVGSLSQWGVARIVGRPEVRIKLRGVSSELIKQPTVHLLEAGEGESGKKVSARARLDREEKHPTYRLPQIFFKKE